MHSINDYTYNTQKFSYIINDHLFKLYVQVDSDAYNSCTSVQVIITMQTCVHFIEIAKHFQTKLRKCIQSDYQSKITTIDFVWLWNYAPQIVQNCDSDHYIFARSVEWFNRRIRQKKCIKLPQSILLTLASLFVAAL